MKYRKLRIAWSVAWGVVAVLLLVLCVRSYWWGDVVHCPAAQPVIVNSARGVLQINRYPNDAVIGWEPGWGWTAISPDKFSNRSSLSWGSYPTVTFVTFPVWPFVLAALMAASLPYPFSLRTLLIVTTLVAVGLGLVVWVA